MAISPHAGKPAPKELLINPARLEQYYYERYPDLADPTRLVSFGTSGHRGPSLRGTVVTANGWFAVRPSGTENIYKLYAESFRDEQHLNAILTKARQIARNALTHGARK